jgi:signal transduction histidine kinase
MTRSPSIGQMGPLPTRGLRFSDDDLEASFSDHYFSQALPRTRFALVLAVVLFALFGILDAFIVPDQAPTIWLIRYAIICPLGLLVLAATYTSSFERIMQPTLSAFAALGGLGIVAMIAIADVPGAYLYYAGLVLVIFWLYTLLQLRFSYATATCLVIVASYEVVAIWFRETPIEFLINNNFFFLSAAILGATAGYTIERGMRTEFLQRRVIESQRTELQDRNVQLDSALRASLDEVRRQAEELRASRARIVVAGDIERRRIERNLHDGAQQQLVAMAVKLSLAESLIGRDEELGPVLGQLRSDSQEALDTLRDLARGIYPPLLADHGLVVAIESQAKKAPLPVEVSGDGVGRYASEIEAALYFSVLEALQNVVKYADATKASVTLSAHRDSLTFEVTDDGVGFDTQAVARGIGLQSMSDRLEALGGSLVVRSTPGGGTTVGGAVRCSQTPAAHDLAREPSRS